MPEYKPQDLVQQGMDILNAACASRYPGIFLPTILEQATKEALEAEKNTERDPYRDYFHKTLLALDRLGVTDRGRAIIGQGYSTIHVIGLPGSFQISPPVDPDGSLQIDHHYRVKKKILWIFPSERSVTEIVKMSLYTRTALYAQGHLEDDWRVDLEALKGVVDPFYESVMDPRHTREALLNRSKEMKDQIIERTRSKLYLPKRRFSWGISVDGEVLLLNHALGNYTTEKMRVEGDGSISYQHEEHHDRHHSHNSIQEKAKLTPDQILNPHGAFLKLAEVHRQYLG